MPKPKRETYKVTMPDGTERTFNNHDDITPFQFAQDVAMALDKMAKIESTPVATVATYAKIQRVKASK